MIKALKSHIEAMIAEGNHEHWLFPDIQGGPMRANNFIRRSFKPLLKRAGLPDIRFHDLRHTFATLALRQGVSVKVLQEILGHANIRITLDIYAHVLPDMQQEAIDKMSGLLGGSQIG